MPLSDGFCAPLGLTAPVVQAPIGSAATPELAAAVSNAGGLGVLALSWTPLDRCAERVAATAARTQRPFGVNLVLQWDQLDRLRACLDAGVRVVSTSWGDPGPARRLTQAAGALHVHMVASPQEARQAVGEGVDAVVAQGWEAGGHVAGRIASLALVPEVVDAVGPVPVLAAGGIADGRGLAAALALGAVAGWIGTRFLMATEADVHPEYRRQLARATAGDAVHNGAFDGGWPDAPHRTLRNETLAAWEDAGRPPAGSRPGEGEVVARTTAGRAVPRYDSDLPTTSVIGDAAARAMALYAGQGVAACSQAEPAAAIVQRLVTDARQQLTRLSADW